MVHVSAHAHIPQLFSTLLVNIRVPKSGLQAHHYSDLECTYEEIGSKLPELKRAVVCSQAFVEPAPKFGHHPIATTNAQGFELNGLHSMISKERKSANSMHLTDFPVKTTEWNNNQFCCMRNLLCAIACFSAGDMCICTLGSMIIRVNN